MSIPMLKFNLGSWHFIEFLDSISKNWVHLTLTTFLHRYGYFQLGGFVLLMLGTGLYNELIYIPAIGTPRPPYPPIDASSILDNGYDGEDSRPLLSDGSLRHW